MTVPLLRVMGRGAWGVTFALSYNSQVWNQNSAGTRLLGYDAGYGFGWRISAGSLTPIWAGSAFSYYMFIDSTGTEYRLTAETNGTWTTKEGPYLEYVEGEQRLYFPDGSFWLFDCIAAGSEPDEGSRYPTRMQDTNGNQVLVRYLPGVGQGQINTSSRIAEIEDVRARSGAITYRFNYDTGSPRRLLSITDMVGSGSGWSFAYTAGYALTNPLDPAAPPVGSTTVLSSVTDSRSETHTFAYATGTGEMTSITFPRQGSFRWEYRSFTHAGKTVREVSSRASLASQSSAEQITTFTHDDVPANALHGRTTVQDPTGAAKVWLFETTPDSWLMGLPTSLEERVSANGTALRRVDYAWSQDALGTPYISSQTTTLDPGAPAQQQTRTENVIDVHGNVLSVRIFDFNALSTPVRVYSNTYVSTSAFTSRHIWNRLLSSTVTQGSQNVTLVSNTYDAYGLEARSGVGHWVDPGTVRGDVTESRTPGKTRRIHYDVTGAIAWADDGYNHTVSYTPAPETDYAAPGVISLNSVTDSTYAYNANLSPTSVTWRNGDAVSATYDSNARPTVTVSPYGARTTYTYELTATTATTNGRWTRTTSDGFDRTVKVESGDATGTKSIVDTEYAPCACSPLGKVARVSQRYAPGGAVYWTTYTYDALGRTTRIDLPGGTGATAYAYSGNLTTVTDPAGKWKRYAVDALGNLVQVTEPAPEGGTHETYYAYNALNQLTSVSMPRGGYTQTRSFNYDLATGRLTSTTNPENGTVTYAYNADGTLASKTDAKGQTVSFTYDTYGRVTRRNAGCASVDYYYDTNPLDSQFSSNILGRLAAVRYGGDSCTGGSFQESYSYTAAGLTTKKRFTRTRSNVRIADLDTVYAYNVEGRVSSIQYPGALIIGRGWINGTVWRYSYDTMGRPSGLSRDGIETPYVETAEYGPGGELNRLVYAGISYSDLTRTIYTETRSYNSRSQLTRERLLDTTYYWMPSTVLDVEYRYSSDANDGRITDAKDLKSGEDVTYQYDSLGRLISAAAAGSWNIAWTYDGFGNMLTQLGNGAPSMSLQYNRATNRIITGGHTYDANGNLTAIPLLQMSYDALNRMTQATHDSNGTDQYAYDPWNRMVWNKIQSTGEYVTFYGVFGEVLGRFRVSPEAGGQFAHERRRIYFGGRQILTDDEVSAKANVTDRLGSVRKGVVPGADSYYPFGEIKTGNGDTFATYPRNATSNLHYATNRWYSNQIARFTTPDPWGPSATPGSPQSWNRYAYVQNDPVNFNDRSGLNRAAEYCEWSNDYLTGHEGTFGFAHGPYWSALICEPSFYAGRGGVGRRGGMTRKAPSVPIDEALDSTLQKDLANLPGWLLASQMMNDDCNKNVIGKLTSSLGVDLDKFVSYLRYGATLYDGTKSTATVAGNVTSIAAANALYGVGATVESVFKGLGINAITSITTSTLTVYLRPGAVNRRGGVDNMSLLFHEALHGFGGTLGGTSFFDPDIQQALFGADSPEVGAPSVNITNLIKSNCFK